MKINSNNYEIYFLDYIEGRLNPVESAELLIFVEQSPQLKVEFESLNELCTLTKTNEHCELHSLLKKNPNSLIPEINPVDEKLIDYLEGEPISENTFLFLNKLASIKKSFEQLKLTRLEPDNSIVFSDKGKLKKKTLIVSLQPALSIAAIFVFACITAAIVFFLNESNTDSTQISGNIAKVIPHFNKKETSLAAVTPIKNKVQKSVDLKQIQAYHKEVTPNFSDEVAISRTYEKTPMLESISLHTFDVRSTEKPEIIS